MFFVQGQGTIPQNNEASGPPLPLYPESQQSPVPHEESSQYEQEYGQDAILSHVRICNHLEVNYLNLMLLLSA